MATLDASLLARVSVKNTFITIEDTNDFDVDFGSTRRRSVSDSVSDYSVECTKRLSWHSSHSSTNRGSLISISSGVSSTDAFGQFDENVDSIFRSESGNIAEDPVKSSDAVCGDLSTQAMIRESPRALSLHEAIPQTTAQDFSESSHLAHNLQQATPSTTVHDSSQKENIPQNQQHPIQHGYFMPVSSSRVKGASNRTRALPAMACSGAQASPSEAQGTSYGAQGAPYGAQGTCYGAGSSPTCPEVEYLVGPQARGALPQQPCSQKQSPATAGSSRQQPPPTTKGIVEKHPKIGKACNEPESGKNERTTVMIKNLPNNFSRQMLLDFFDLLGLSCCYNFVYLPMDFCRCANLGYAFVNMESTSDAKQITALLHGFKDWKFCASDKVCEVSWGHPLQGLDAHVQRFRNSPVMHQDVPDHFKPLLFANGVATPLPPPTRRLRMPRANKGAPCWNKPK